MAVVLVITFITSVTTLGYVVKANTAEAAKREAELRAELGALNKFVREEMAGMVANLTKVFAQFVEIMARRPCLAEDKPQLFEMLKEKNHDR